MKLSVGLGMAFIVLASGSSGAEELGASAEKAAMAFSRAADDCLVDVRDKKMSYLSSFNCAKLGKASLAYISSPGVQLTYSESKVIPKHAYIAVSAKATAWSAAALSNAFAPQRNAEYVLSLW